MTKSLNYAFERRERERLKTQKAAQKSAGRQSQTAGEGADERRANPQGVDGQQSDPA